MKNSFKRILSIILAVSMLLCTTVPTFAADGELYLADLRIIYADDYEEAKEILQQIYFYPPAKHSYRTSICGRACDRACYIHLEEKGLLTKKFQRKFREKEDWKLSTKQFETGVREKEWDFGGKK
jgi:hypothetical protein